MYLTQSLHRAVQQTPDSVATIFGDRVRTFREVADRVARLAGALQGLGVAEGDRVGVLALNSDRFHEALYATWWIGGAVNPVNIRWSAKEIAYSLKESETRVLFVDDAFVPLVPQLLAEWDGVTTLVHCGDRPIPAGMLSYELIAVYEPVEDLRLGAERMAGIFYTGGTTGYPKGVMLSHANILTTSYAGLATAQGSLPNGRTLNSAPMFHLAGLAAWNQQNVMAGSHVFLSAFEPAAVLKAIAEHRPTTLLLVPVMIQMLVDHLAIGEYDLSSVQRIIYGASAISEALLQRAMKAFPQAGFAQGYGMTELSPVATQLTPEDHRDQALLRSAGRAAVGIEVRIVDLEDKEVPRGTVGEIVVRSAGVMLGYWKKPEETAEALRGGWMHTGDAGRMDDNGYVFVVDRIKDMIVTGAENVYSAEVENALAQHSAVASCAVIGVPDPEWGERVHAVVVLQPGATATAGELRGHCKSLIAGYKSPRTVEFVEAMPLSAAGKILKRELRRPYWENAERAVS
ncbi:long-chain fatty acid--CoA ligase [Peterkaempfera sp. SMS 1(5)a]|uniref:acyl-CoA synthetase n=1 Tax=Peterkaempfera podocarpi TaxID=3232308 RepID=UPI00366F0A9C